MDQWANAKEDNNQQLDGNNDNKHADAWEEDQWEDESGKDGDKDKDGPDKDEN